MYYEITIKRTGLDENGKEKRFTEKYLMDALSIIEVAQRFEEKISVLYPGHETVSVKRTGYSEVVTDESADTRYFHTKYNTVMLDDNTGKEKKVAQVILIQADDYDSAKAKYEEHTKGWLCDIELTGLVESKIIEYFPAKFG